VSRRPSTLTPPPQAEGAPAAAAISSGSSSNVRSYPAATRASWMVGSKHPPVRARLERQGDHLGEFL